MQRPHEDKLKYETQVSWATRPIRHSFTAMGKVNYYVCNLEPSIRKQMLIELRLMSPHVRSNLIDTERTTAAKRLCQQALMKHAQPQQLMNNKTIKRELSTFTIRDTPDAPFPRSNLPK